ncbi:unnamed protein product [Rotaria sp. Silwood2]|nr:unnamed protein product [Rotaria sp. Silwood2]CAF3470519.1 unnamed protein product [Rotaria sp. Silwood2]
MSTNAKAETTDRPHRKLALVIGIGEYEDCKLENSENDAHDLSYALESIGFIVTKTLNPKRNELKHILIDFEESVQAGDMILFYFSGNGVQWEVSATVF